MEGEKALEQFSPEILIRNPSSNGAIPLLPRIVLFHGTSDNSIPSDERLVYLFENVRMILKSFITLWTIQLLLVVNEILVSWPDHFFICFHVYELFENDLYL